MYVTCMKLKGEANMNVDIPDNQRDIDDQSHLHQEDGDSKEGEEAQHPHRSHPNAIATF